MEKEESGSPISLGSYLASIRMSLGMTLREVEEATEKEVSNAYLSQLEHGRIAKPSPNILFSLSQAYGVPYEKLMKKAGYIAPVGTRSPNRKHGRAPTFAISNLTPDEEEELMRYLAYLRSRK